MTEIPLQSEQVDVNLGFPHPGCVHVLVQTGECMWDCRESMDVTWHLFEEEPGGEWTGGGMYIPLWP